MRLRNALEIAAKTEAMEEAHGTANNYSSAKVRRAKAGKDKNLT